MAKAILIQTIEANPDETKQTWELIHVDDELIMYEDVLEKIYDDTDLDLEEFDIKMPEELRMKILEYIKEK